MLVFRKTCVRTKWTIPYYPDFQDSIPYINFPLVWRANIKLHLAFSLVHVLNHFSHFKEEQPPCLSYNFTNIMQFQKKTSEFPSEISLSVEETFLYQISLHLFFVLNIRPSRPSCYLRTTLSTLKSN